MGGIVMLEGAQLRALIVEAVREVMAELPQPPTESRWLTTRDVAELLGVNVRSVQVYARRGMPYRDLGPKTRRYLRDEVLAWFAARKA